MTTSTVPGMILGPAHTRVPYDDLVAVVTAYAAWQARNVAADQLQLAKAEFPLRARSYAERYAAARRRGWTEAALAEVGLPEPDVVAPPAPRRPDRRARRR
jgi:hypothetical protein